MAVIRRAVILSGAMALAACGPGRVERVPIPPGSTLSAAADSLAAHHVIRWRGWFELVARRMHTDRHLHAGIYQFATGSSAWHVARALRSGDAMHFRVTVIPGGTVYDLAHNAREHLGIDSDSILISSRDTALLHRYGIPAPSVEGWLLPESFDFGGFDRARDVLARFIEARVHGWMPAWDSAATTQHLDREEVLTLASIVQAEARDTSELPEIAAVYRNRLKLHMALQADPTVEYAYLMTTGARKGRLFDVDYQLHSPWNTYLHPGLPPGPVGNPTREAIEAVLHPAAVRYLYFVAAPDGRSVFASSYTEQLRNIRRLREQM